MATESSAPISTGTGGVIRQLPRAPGRGPVGRRRGVVRWLLLGVLSVGLLLLWVPLPRPEWAELQQTARAWLGASLRAAWTAVGAAVWSAASRVSAWWTSLTTQGIDAGWPRWAQAVGVVAALVAVWTVFRWTRARASRGDEQLRAVLRRAEQIRRVQRDLGGQSAAARKLPLTEAAGPRRGPIAPRGPLAPDERLPEPPGPSGIARRGRIDLESELERVLGKRQTPRLLDLRVRPVAKSQEISALAAREPVPGPVGAPGVLAEPTEARSEFSEQVARPDEAPDGAARLDDEAEQAARQDEAPDQAPDQDARQGEAFSEAAPIEPQESGGGRTPPTPAPLRWAAVHGPPPAPLDRWLDRRTSVGIDVGSQWIKLVQLRRLGRRSIVARFATRATPRGAVQSGAVADPGALGEAIAALARDSGLTRRRVLAAVSGEASIVRSLRLPPMSDGELAEAMRWEVQQQIPIPPDEAVVDYTVLGQRRDGERRVVLVGTQRATAERLTEAIGMGGLRLTALDAEAIAWSRLLRRLGFPGSPGAAQVVLDLGATKSHLTVLLEGGVALCRTIPATVRPEGEDAAATEEVWGEVVKSIDVFLMRERQVSQVDLFLAGGGAARPGLVELVQAVVGEALATRLGRPATIRRLDAASVDLAHYLEPDRDRFGPQFYLALGLAMREC